MSDALDAYNRECEPLIEELRQFFAPIEREIAAQLDRSLVGDFNIPIEIRSHDTYDEEIADKLYKFAKYVENKPALMRVDGLAEGVQENIELILNALRDERRGETERAREKIREAWQKILCRRFSTKVKNGAVKQSGFWLNSPSLHHSRQCTAVCMPQA